MIELARALIAIEIDPTVQLPRLAPLDREKAEKLVDAVAGDWQRLLPQSGNCGLVVAGAVYDQTQILSPGFGLFETLRELYQGGLQGGFEPACMALGAVDGAMPRPELQPALERLTGPMLIVPLAAVGPSEEIAALARQMEEVLVGAGQVSAATALALNSTFGFQLIHAQYLTTNDLAAMLSLQLTNVGLPELWQLLEGALFAPAEPLWIETTAGCRLALVDGRVEVLFQSFDQWAATAGNAWEGMNLPQQYAAYLRTQRQVTVTLAAHGVPVSVFPLANPPDNLDQWLAERGTHQAAGRIWTELALDGPDNGPVQVTQHSVPELGSVAFTVEWSDAGGQPQRRENHYPLIPAGVPELLKRMQAIEAPDRCFSYPGQIMYDATRRVLIADPDGAPPNWH